MGLDGKHVFFISDRDRFFFLFGDALIEKLGLPAELIVPVVFKSGLPPVNSPKLNDVSYLNYEDVGIEILLEAKSVTFMSLNEWNSPIAKRLIDARDEFLEKIYIFITDDEVDRWTKKFEMNGCLSEDLSLHISESCISVLEKVRYFIAPRPYFHKKICEVTRRNDIEFIDASIIFDVLPHYYSEMMRRVFSESFEYGKSGRRVLVGTKGYSWKDLMKFLNSPAFKKYSSNTQFLCFVSPTRRFLIEAFGLYRKIIGRDFFNITYLSPMSPQMYNAMLASCTHLILQDRGGASTARLFAKWGRGRIAVRRGSPNHVFIEECYGIDLYTYDHEKDINPDFFDGSGFDPSESAKNVCAEERRSLSVLSSLYS
ncbi:hypothetical protein DET50_12423 [Marinobacter pelagius]|uniref:Uncharacterized protein n=2 Tax=Marinobacter pelagius TaxID=379482 RepID=A0A366GFF6_9GAMM|nr:hypothetical protein DET50_12423 [Marinobacter pelagius]